MNESMHYLNLSLHTYIYTYTYTDGMGANRINLIDSN